MRLGLRHQVDDVGERHVAMVGAGIIAPAHMHPQFLGRNVANGVIQRLDVELDELAELREAHVLVVNVPAHREVRAIELHNAPASAMASYSCRIASAMAKT